MEKTYNPQGFEKKWYDFWLKNKYFASKPNKDKKKYSIVMPPLNVTGKAHIGHALNNTIQDILIRTKRMQGFETLWLPGTDHAAIATEEVLCKTLAKEGLSKDIVGREEFLRRGEEWYSKYSNTICEQLMSMGVSCDWDRKAFTMDENLSRAVRHVFVEYYKKGYIYKGKRVVNYCPSCRTTISDNENVYKEFDTKLWYIKYPFADGSGSVTVATTRPETIFGDTAVAVNPKDPKYQGLIGKELLLPLTDRKIKLIGDDYCEIGFGTGAVKITPAHDPNDYEVGLRHNLEIITCIGDDGILNENAGKFAGLDRDKARVEVEKELKAQGYLIKTEKYKHKTGTCERCGTVTEPKISTQWFVAMKELARPALEVVKNGKISFVPKRFEKQYINWLDGIKDWCISRQIWLGHRIPVFYCEECGNTMVEMEDPTECSKCHSKHIHEDNDVLDTWFSSALWPFSTLGYPNRTEELEYYYPTNVLVTGYDIITFWVTKMVFSGLEFMKDIPFKDVLINGIVRDAKGVKMSKHLGNGIDPIEMIEKYGADSLRLSLINGMSMGTDLKYSEEKIMDAKIFINKLFNASKFVLSNIEGMKFEEITQDKLSQKDKWLLKNLNETIKAVTKNIEKYNLSMAVSKLIDFTYGVFCDWYIELAKLDMREGDERKTTTQNLLYTTLDTILKLFHPFIPFVTEEIYQELPKHAETIMTCAFPTEIKGLNLSNKFDKVVNLIKAIRVTRSEFKLADNQRTNLYIKLEDEKKLYSESIEAINKLGFGKETKVIENESELPDKFTKVLGDGASVYILTGELASDEKKKEKLEKELALYKAEIERGERMLSNPGFVAKAPEKLIENEKNKLAKNKEMYEKILGELNA